MILIILGLIYLYKIIKETEESVSHSSTIPEVTRDTAPTLPDTMFTPNPPLHHFRKMAAEQNFKAL